MIDLSYLPYKLKQEQLDALEFCLNRNEAIMSLGTGVGKTITSCCLIKHYLDIDKKAVVVFIIPSKAIKAFQKEMKLCNLEYNLWESSDKKDIKDSRITIVTHTALAKYNKDIIKFIKNKNAIGVVDEIHNFSANYDSPKPILNKGTKALVNIRPNFKKFYALTATTVKNNVMSLYTMCNIVKPFYLGSPSTFKKKYCKIQQQFIRIKSKNPKFQGYTKTIEKVTGLKDSKELNRLKDNLIIFRQLKYDVVYNDIDIELDSNLWNKYKYIGEGLFMKSKPKNQLSEFSIRLIELQKLMDNCSEFYDPYLISNKEKALIKLIKQLFKEGHIPIIYCFYLDTIGRVKKVLEESGIKIDDIFVISGQIPKKERALVEDKIAKNTVTIINKAGTESINLQKADTMIYYNIPWSIDEYLQSIGRITRNDTKFDKQYVYFLQYEGTIDNYKALNINNRLNVVEQFQGEQIISSDGIHLSETDRSKLKQFLLWCTKLDKPLSKEELLNKIQKR